MQKSSVWYSGLSNSFSSDSTVSCESGPVSIAKAGLLTHQHNRVTTHLGCHDRPRIGSPAQQQLHGWDIALQDREAQCLVEKMLLHGCTRCLVRVVRRDGKPVVGLDV